MTCKHGSPAGALPAPRLVGLPGWHRPRMQVKSLADPDADILSRTGRACWARETSDVAILQAAGPGFGRWIWRDLRLVAALGGAYHGFASFTFRVVVSGKGTMSRIVAVGEVMLELSGREGTQWSLGAAGDTFNTAVHCARLGADVAYLTALGCDPFSDEMLARFRAENVATDLVLRDRERTPGLYAIRTDESGERSFHYWRSESAARALFEQPGIDAALQAAAKAGLLYLSGITLSLYDDAGRGRLVDLAAAVRRGGGRVAFDPNYRSAAWSSPEVAREAFARMAQEVDMVLPTFADERELFGDAQPRDTIRRWQALGVAEAALKLGAQGCMVAGPGGTEEVAPDIAVRPTDTTGAGDSFNAAYLVARRGGASRVLAARAGNALAARTITSPGALGKPTKA